MVPAPVTGVKLAGIDADEYNSIRKKAPKFGSPRRLSMTTFNEVWARIVAKAGDTFHQVRGGAFRYQIRGDYLIPDRSNYPIPRAHFAEAFRLAPLRSTTDVHHLRGPSYIYAILMDPRIRQGDSAAAPHWTPSSASPLGRAAARTGRPQVPRRTVSGDLRPIDTDPL